MCGWYSCADTSEGFDDQFRIIPNKKAAKMHTHKFSVDTEPMTHGLAHCRIPSKRCWVGTIRNHSQLARIQPIFGYEILLQFMRNGNDMIGVSHYPGFEALQQPVRKTPPFAESHILLWYTAVEFHD